MNFKIHSIAAKKHLEIAENFNTEYEKEKDTDTKIALRIIAAQNYFYAGINAIEAVLAREKAEHSFNHENRLRKVLENSNLFDEDILNLYPLIDRNERNAVAYRGEDGKKYQNIKEFARKSVSGLNG